MEIFPFSGVKMKKVLGLAILAIAVLTAGAVSAHGSVIAEVREELRQRIGGGKATEEVFCRGELLCASRILPLFYEKRSFSPVWIGEPGQTEALLGQIQQADREGLNPEDYRLSGLRALLAEIGPHPGSADPGRLADLELLLTDTFLIYASHLLHGRVNPQSIRAEWHVQSRKADLTEILQTAAEQKKIAEALQSLLPPHPGYFRLRQALKDYGQIAGKGGWARVPAGGSMRKGQRDERVKALRDRLGGPDGLLPTQEPPELFDEALEEAVTAFQVRHGLDGDGIVGSATLEALNIPAEERIRQIKVNLERWRWLPQDLGARRILVNIADFTLQVMEENLPVMGMRVVVGKSYQRTPVFSALLSAVVIRPYWNIPSSIVQKEIIPAIRKNPDYLSKNRIRVFSGWGANEREIDPAAISWPEGKVLRFPFRMRQDAGLGNSLGHLKFAMPNPYAVYLHDTPARTLFRQSVRGFSHGCIRIENPLDLSVYLLQGDPLWDKEKILAAMNGAAVDRAVRLQRPIPVHILYWTAWAEDNGAVQFRGDIYRRDGVLEKALAEPLPRDARQ